MSSDTDICNAALGLLGDPAQVASISPPSGSIQAIHCARFYPMVRDTLLEMHPWGFATKRVALALLAQTPPSPWSYTYQLPSDVLNTLAILDSAAVDDFSAGLAQYGNVSGAYNYNVGIYTTQPYATEADPTGDQVLYTNQVGAVLRYTGRVTDTTQFSPLFVECLSWLLASKLAGPVIKGSEGRAMAAECLKDFRAFFGVATASDSNQHRQKPAQSVDWIVNR